MGLWQSSAASAEDDAPWMANIINQEEEAIKIAGQAKRVAVLGIAPESRADRAAHYVAKSLQDDGVQIVPVPVYYFDAKASLHTESDQATSKYLNMHGQGNIGGEDPQAPTGHPECYMQRHPYLLVVGACLDPDDTYFNMYDLYAPAMQEILGENVYRRLQDIPSPETIDVLDVFRRAEDLDPHLPDILELKPKVVWLQSGISDRRFEEIVAKAGIKVVPDRCMKVDRGYAKAKL